jgi:hypothetical protein
LQQYHYTIKKHHRNAAKSATEGNHEKAAHHAQKAGTMKNEETED